ncbi:TetR/AcrR family transcriptional regulator [Dactylosporangium matsuzakiense]|uniref:TetR family transcriptional regulator n=1 Tax=Dactylosporangium matsuzakiense TaxID=53360 RepID=A0A9W6KU78_9ACTN|nr:TetR/AcrR family transcriptional regulator [Dactylosporangium matsuzakiense]GLL08162.1 TetR family transcriptional regulator [Dactylosporangium matsuzakiense]
MPPTPPRRRLLPAPERAASILRAAASIFGEQGYTRTTMEDIATRAKVSKLVIYRHFNSKQELYLAILDQLRRRLETVVPPPAPVDPADHAAAFRQAELTLAAEFAIARESPDAYRLLLRHAAHEPEFAGYVAQVKAAAHARIEDMLGPADPVLRSWMARVVGTTVDEAFLEWLDAGDPARDAEMVRRVTYLLGSMVGSLRAGGEGQRP